MEKLTSPSAALVEKSKKYPSEGCDHIRSELILMQKKYKRLEQKERRMQVQPNCTVFLSLFLFQLNHYASVLFTFIACWR